MAATKSKPLISNPKTNITLSWDKEHLESIVAQVREADQAGTSRVAVFDAVAKAMGPHIKPTTVSSRVYLYMGKHHQDLIKRRSKSPVRRSKRQARRLVLPDIKREETPETPIQTPLEALSSHILGLEAALAESEARANRSDERVALLLTKLERIRKLTA